MRQLAKHQRIVASRGPAVGKITGINHLVLFARNMDESIRFYRDILGLKIVKTQPRFSTNALSLRERAGVSAGSVTGAAAVDLSVRQIFFALGNGELFSLYEAAEVDPRPDASVVSFLWPPAATKAPVRPQKLDHLAFNVNTRADLEWFRTRLLAHDVAVSDVIERGGENGRYKFLTSIYFSDPSNNPLEIATFHLDDPAWIDYDYTEWLQDEEPAAALLEEEDQE